MKKKTLTVKDNRNGKTYEFQVKDGSYGPAVADLSSFYEETGMFVYDPGFKSTASCESKITFIDGEKGILLYRGFPIDELAEKGLKSIKTPKGLRGIAARASGRAAASEDLRSDHGPFTRGRPGGCRGEGTERAREGPTATAGRGAGKGGGGKRETPKI